MKIAQHYKYLKEQIPTFTNEEYLQSHIMQLKNMFHNEIAAIKNINLEFIAFTKHFAEALNFNENYLDKRLEQINTQTPQGILQNNKQEMKLINSRKSQIILFFANVNGSNHCFLTRKFPLINPSTQDVVGILMIAKKIDILEFRRMLSTTFLKREAVYNIPTTTEQLTEKQSSIVACLLLGFHKRKEIAHILDKYMSHSMNEQQIKYSLQLLYDRYKCSSTSELINAICSDPGIEYEIPAKLIPDGVIAIESL